MGELLKEMIEKHLDIPCLFFYEGSSKKTREEMVDLFQNDPNYRFMVLSIKAAGVGLNLTAANHVVHYDLWWNPAVENQATDRAFSIGQRKDVTVYRLITLGTFEEKINSILEAKKELAELTVSEGEQWLTKMSTGDLKELIELSEGFNMKDNRSEGESIQQSRNWTKIAYWLVIGTLAYNLVEAVVAQPAN
jgi:SNF2 family DNA or RNA helicase